MLETLIMATLALGLLSLVAWLVLGGRPADRRAERRPEVSGRVVGAIGVSMPVTRSRTAGQGGGGGAEMAEAPAVDDNLGEPGAEVRQRPLAAGGP